MSQLERTWYIIGWVYVLAMSAAAMSTLLFLAALRA